MSTVIVAGASAIALEVAAIEDPAPGVRTLRLTPAPGEPALTPYAPGAHVEVEAGDRRNAYSLIGDPRDTSHYAISVLRCDDGLGGSRFLHEQVRPGDRLRVGRPKSAFAPPAAARSHLLVAAGIGVTPFLSYARAFARTGTPYALHAVHRLGFEPHAGLDELPSGRVTHHAGRDAFWSALPELLNEARLGTHLSVCGPPDMIESVLDAARQRGWPEHRLHSERFKGIEAPPGEPFRAHLMRAGVTVDVPSGTSLLDALLSAGAQVPFLCRQGICGECRVGVLGGVPDHHDLHLSQAQRDAGNAVMPCVSRCTGAELDLDL